MSFVNSIFYIVILIMSVVVHEVAHGVAAYKLGDQTAKAAGRLTLNPLKHLELFGSVLLPLFLILVKAPFLFGWARPVPYNPRNLRNQRWGTLIVASAGIIANFILAGFFALVLKIASAAGLPIDQANPSSFVVIIDAIIFINILLGVFNLMPIPPLDGSKILFSLLPPSARNFENFLERYALPLLIVFLIFLWKFIAPLIFLIFSWLTG